MDKREKGISPIICSRITGSDLHNIHLNVVRAGVVDHPAEWAHSGYREIQEPPERYAIIDLRGLMALCGFAEVADFQLAHRQWIEE
jgi:putative transposase